MKNILSAGLLSSVGLFMFALKGLWTPLLSKRLRFTWYFADLSTLMINNKTIKAEQADLLGPLRRCSFCFLHFKSHVSVEADKLINIFSFWTFIHETWQ